MLHFLFNWFVKITGWILYLFCFRTKVHYQDKKVQSRRIKGKAIIASNHRSIFDVALMMFLFPFRTLRCVVAEVMFNKNFLMTLFLKCLGAIKVDRNTTDFAFIDKAEKILNKNGVVEIYPEARLPIAGEKSPLAFKPSAVYIALNSGAPIIPIYTNGSYFNKKRAEVIIGTPIDARELYDDNLSEQENITNINEILRNKIIELGAKIEKREQEKEI